MPCHPVEIASIVSNAHHFQDGKSNDQSSRRQSGLYHRWHHRHRPRYRRSLRKRRRKSGRGLSLGVAKPKVRRRSNLCGEQAATPCFLNRMFPRSLTCNPPFRRLLRSTAARRGVRQRGGGRRVGSIGRANRGELGLCPRHQSQGPVALHGILRFSRCSTGRRRHCRYLHRLPD